MHFPHQPLTRFRAVRSVGLVQAPSTCGLTDRAVGTRLRCLPASISAFHTSISDLATATVPLLFTCITDLVDDTYALQLRTSRRCPRRHFPHLAVPTATGSFHVVVACVRSWLAVLSLLIAVSFFLFCRHYPHWHCARRIGSDRMGKDGISRDVLCIKCITAKKRVLPNGK
jgi:hypothetical protein